MAKKKTSAKKAQSKGDTNKARKDAIKDIDQRLNGDASPAKPTSAAKGKTAPSKAASKKTASKKVTVKKDPKPKRMSGLDAAAQVLAEAGKPLNCIDIMEGIIKKRLWARGSGKLPEPNPLQTQNVERERRAHVTALFVSSCGLGGNT